MLLPVLTYSNFVFWGEKNINRFRLVSSKKKKSGIFSDELAISKVLGRKWALSILKNLDTKEAIRFNELRRLMPGISSTVLAKRLSR